MTEHKIGNCSITLFHLLLCIKVPRSLPLCQPILIPPFTCIGWGTQEWLSYVIPLCDFIMSFCSYLCLWYLVNWWYNYKFKVWWVIVTCNCYNWIYKTDQDKMNTRTLFFLFKGEKKTQVLLWDWQQLIYIGTFFPQEVS